MFPEKVRVILGAIWDNGFYSKNIECKELAIDNLLPNVLSLIESEDIKKAEKWHKKGWDDCKGQILKLLPKEKQIDYAGTYTYDPFQREAGFNQCLHEIKEKLEDNNTSTTK